MKSRQADPEPVESLRALLKARAEAVASAAEHPSTSELASFFYGSASGKGVRAHVAVCQSCAAELALYAQAERTAEKQERQEKTAAEIPAVAWQLIRDWEESDFARPKAEGEARNADLLNRLAQVVATRKDIRQARKSVLAREPNRVPVVVVNRSGELRGVEVFKRAAGKRGETTLVPAEPLTRYENVEIHALVYQDAKTYDIASYRVVRNTVRVGAAPKEGQAAVQTDFFIIEE